MRIKFISERAQKSEFNQAKIERFVSQHIPFVDRNAETGWPLFQVSLFTPLKEDPTRYRPRLDQRNFFYIGAFDFARLLTRIPGQLDIKGDFHHFIRKNQVHFDHMGLFLEQFDVYHQQLDIRVRNTMGGYGKLLFVNYPQQKSNILALRLGESFNLILKDDAKISCFQSEEDLSYTQEQIEAAIQPSLGIFYQGQIFADLGAFLNECVQDAECTEYFKTVFKVEEFMDCSKVAVEPSLPDSFVVKEKQKKQKRVTFFEEAEEASVCPSKHLSSQPLVPLKRT